MKSLDVRIVIPGLPITLPDPFAVALGGSETAGLQLAAALARKGHRVVVFCNIGQTALWRGCALAPMRLFVDNPATRAGDLLLAQDAPDLFTLPHTARCSILHLHCTPEPWEIEQIRAGLPAIDHVAFVSNWQARQYQAAMPDLPAEKMFVLRNGIDLELIAEATAEAPERDPFAILHTAQFARGLEVLLVDVLPRILEREPRARLHLAFYDTDPTLTDTFWTIAELAAPLRNHIVSHGPLGKRALYRLMTSTGLLIHSTPSPSLPEFAETSCISAMEAMACGLPWVSTDAGALPETLAGAGVLVPLAGAPHAAARGVPERLAAEALRVMTDPEHAARLRLVGRGRAKALSWDDVADQVASVAADAMLFKVLPADVAEGRAA